MVGEIRSTEPNAFSRSNENQQDDHLPFCLEYDSRGNEGSPTFPMKKSSIKSTYGFDLNTQQDRAGSALATPNNVNFTPRKQPEKSAIRLEGLRTSERNLADPLVSLERRLANTDTRGIS